MAGIWLGRGASTVPPLPKIRYWGRPAFHLLVSTVLGLVVAHSGYLMVGTIVIVLLAVVPFLHRRLKQWRAHSYLFLWSLLFAFYAHFRAEPLRVVQEGVTLYETELTLHYPMASSQESAWLYHASLNHKGQTIDLRLHLPKDMELPPDQCFRSAWVATIDLAPLSSIRLDSFRHYLLSEGYEAEGYLQRLHSYEGRRHVGAKALFQEWRAGLIEKFDQVAQAHITERNRGLIYALVLGERGYLPQDVKESFTAAGVAHILAVSGYHLGVVFTLLLFLFRFLLPHYPQRHLRYLILFLSVTAYALLCGASTATMRALFMTSMLLLTKALDRRVDPIQLLSLTLLFFLFLEPFAYRSVGLLLSVGAVWGIYLFVPLFHRLLTPSHRVLKYLLNIVLVTLSAQLGVLPFLFYFFGTSTFSFIWSNIPLVVLSGILIPFGLGTLLVGQLLGWLPPLILKLLGWFSQAMSEVAIFFSRTDAVWLDDFTVRYDLVLIILHYAIVLILYDFLYLYLVKRHFRTNTTNEVYH